MPDLTLVPGLLASPHRFAWHQDSATAILADLHLGAFGRGMGGVGGVERVVGGVGGAGQMARAWSRLTARNPKRVILLGDLLDDPAVTGAVIDEFRQCLALLPPSCEVLATPGNHDSPDLGRQLRITTAEALRIGRFVLSHGHRLPESLPLPADCIWIVGHQHPAVTLRTRAAAAKMACYVVCEAGRQRPGLILLPAFSRAAGGPLGSNLQNRANWILPCPRPDPARMQVFGLIEPESGESQVLNFGTLAGLRDVT